MPAKDQRAQDHPGHHALGQERFQREGNGQASPSIASLERIAGALGVTLGDFFAVSGPKAAVVVRADARREFVSQWSRAQIEALTPMGPGHLLETLMITLEPGGRSAKEPHAYSTEVFVVVFEGKVYLTLDNERQLLRRGDAVTLPPGTLHRWEQCGTEQACLLIVSARPAGGVKL